MDIREKVNDVFITHMADYFMLDKTYIEAHPDLRFKEDLAANSIKYFPLVAALEEDLDITIDFHEFQYAGKTVAMAIDYIVGLCILRHK